VLGRVVTLGAHVLDVLVRPVMQLPAHDAAAVVDDIRLTVAGTAGAVAVNLARLGAQVTTVGAVGDDAIGRLVVELLEEEGVEAGQLVRRSDSRSSTSVIPVASDGSHCTWHVRGAINRLTLEDVDFDTVAAADVLHIGGPDALGRFAGDPLVQILRHARALGVTTTLDLLGPATALTLARLSPILGLIDHATPNRGQVSGLTKLDSPRAGAAALRERGVGTVYVTMGEDGSLVAGPNGDTHVPALPADVVDTTGSGDGYTAGVIAGILLGWEPATAAWLASAVAALVASGLGSDGGLVSLDQALLLARRGSGAASVELPPFP
jgi:sugar/nucleoside kinase (ribokinase family)